MNDEDEVKNALKELQSRIYDICNIRRVRENDPLEQAIMSLEFSTLQKDKIRQASTAGLARIFEGVASDTDFNKELYHAFRDGVMKRASNLDLPIYYVDERGETLESQKEVIIDILVKMRSYVDDILHNYSEFLKNRGVDGDSFEHLQRLQDEVSHGAEHILGDLGVEDWKKRATQIDILSGADHISAINFDEGWENG